MHSLVKLTLSFGLFAILLPSCKDEELNSLMDEYCNCLNENEGDVIGRNSCITLMDSIQKKYENQPRKLNKVIEKAGKCN